MQMKRAIEKFCFVSVRDTWTQQMFSYITDKEINPLITPDPVFAFNQNASHLVPTKETIIKKFNIPQNYIILSFKGAKSVNQNWIDKFQNLANERGFTCIKLPYSDAQAFGDIQFSVGEVISPLEWYALIKYSSGYIGNNMHPIVTSIANGVPFFSFDNYGIIHRQGHNTKGESSKIYHILKTAGFLSNRIYVRGANYIMPSPSQVLDSVLNFDKEKELAFANNYLVMYNEMMSVVHSIFENIYSEDILSK